MLSRVQPFVTPWTVAPQAPLSMEFSRQEYGRWLPLPTPGDLPDPGIEPESLMPLAFTGRFFTTEPPGKPTPEYVMSQMVVRARKKQTNKKKAE